MVIFYFFRKDGLVLNHWRRVTEEGKDYPFARFNKICEVANYTEVEYNRYLENQAFCTTLYTTTPRI